MKIRIDRTKCSGIGRCEALAPKVFQVDEEGVLHLLEDGDIPAGEETNAEAAIAQCPMAALSRG